MYQPNFKNKLVVDRTNKAIGFVLKYLSSSEERPCAKTQLDKYLGQQQNKLGKFLRQKLIICTNERYNKDLKITKKYIYNPQGINELRNLINNNCVYYAYSVLPLTQNTDEMVYQQALQEYGQELDKKQFVFTESKTHPRLMHGLQNYSKTPRNRLLKDKGFIFEYDIECCAPTVILYHAYQLGTGEYMPTITHYINNRKHHRQRISQELEITEHTAKEIVNALFCGGRLVINEQYCKIYQKLNLDKAKMMFLQQDPWIQQLKQEIKQCWEHIIPHYEYMRQYNKLGRKKPFSAKQKWNIYFLLERKCLDQVIHYMHTHHIHYYPIHDGWHTTKPINTHEVEQLIYNNTSYNNQPGFIIKIGESK